MPGRFPTPTRSSGPFIDTTTAGAAPPQPTPQHPGTVFHRFLGAHSLLIGLLPFYLPAYLWGNGYDLAALCLLIGVSGFTFCAALTLWQLTAARCTLGHIMALSFAFEFLLIFLVAALGDAPKAAAILGIANGLYNGFFWTTQRALFLQLLGENDSGRRYGNFQIFVTIFLKLGILLGGWMLDLGGIAGLLLVSAVVGIGTSVWLARSLPASSRLTEGRSTALLDSLRSSDTLKSRRVFAIDGIFLFLESHFWTLSLFLVVHEDYSRLGIVVVVLALVFAALFYIMKNLIDGFSPGRVYAIAVWLYALSWWLRVLVVPALGNQMLVALLVVITFLSSLFRLAFNKRFFDNARETGRVRYLLIKSYWSQGVIGLFFCLLAVLLAATNANVFVILGSSYAIAGCIALVYLAYGVSGTGRDLPASA